MGFGERKMEHVFFQKEKDKTKKYQNKILISKTIQ